MAEGQPTARGTLGDKPLCELLVYMLSRGLSGSLVLQAPNGGRHALSFARGGVVKARVDCPNTKLGQVMIALGYFDAAACARIADEGQGLFGQRARAAGVSEDQLQRALREQRLRQVTWLSLLPCDTAFGYYQDVDHLQNWGGDEFSVDALAAIWAAIRELPGGPRVDEARKRLGDKVLRLHATSRVARFEFSASERAVLDVLRVKPQTYTDLLATDLAKEVVLSRIVYALALTKHLDLGGRPIGVSGPRRSLGAATAASSAKRSQVSPPRASKRAKEVVDEVLETGDYLTRAEIMAKKELLEGEPIAYEILGIAPDLPQANVAEHFSQLARRWHPDRLQPDLEDLRADVTRVFARMTEAYRSVGSADARAQYDGTLAGESREEEEQRQVANVLRAAGAFQKAQILLKKRDHAQAEAFAKMAADGDPDQPEYVALYAWICAKKPTCSPSELLENLAVLRKAASAQGNNARITFYLATVLKLAGNESEAMKQFERVVALDPSNLDAARELRIYRMRGNSSPGQAPSLLGRLFKR